MVILTGSPNGRLGLDMMRGEREGVGVGKKKKTFTHDTYLLSVSFYGSPTLCDLPPSRRSPPLPSSLHLQALCNGIKVKKLASFTSPRHQFRSILSVPRIRREITAGSQDQPTHPSPTAANHPTSTRPCHRCHLPLEYATALSSTPKTPPRMPVGYLSF